MALQSTALHESNAVVTVGFTFLRVLESRMSRICYAEWIIHVSNSGCPTVLHTFQVCVILFQLGSMYLNN